MSRNDDRWQKQMVASACGTATAVDGPVSSFCACPACGGPLMDIRHKLQCQRCHTIVETCCEGGRG